MSLALGFALFIWSSLAALSSKVPLRLAIVLSVLSKCQPCARGEQKQAYLLASIRQLPELTTPVVVMTAFCTGVLVEALLIGRMRGKG